MMETLRFDPTMHDLESISEGVKPQIRDEALMSVPNLMNCRVIGEFTPLGQTVTQDRPIKWTRQEVWSHIDHAEKKFCHRAEILGLEQ
jgi:hypothetical protein